MGNDDLKELLDNPDTEETPTVETLPPLQEQPPWLKELLNRMKSLEQKLVPVTNNPVLAPVDPLKEIEKSFKIMDRVAGFYGTISEQMAKSTDKGFEFGQEKGALEQYVYSLIDQKRELEVKQETLTEKIADKEDIIKELREELEEKGFTPEDIDRFFDATKDIIEKVRG